MCTEEALDFCAVGLPPNIGVHRPSAGTAHDQSSQETSTAPEDFDGEGILPKRQRQRLRQLKVQERDRLKTKHRKAWVAIDEELQQLLSEHETGYVLQNDRGGAMERNLRRTFAGMVKGTKFEGLKPYDLRHTFAMRLIEAGVDVRTAAEMMRHTPEVFLRRYVRSDKERKLDAIRRLKKDKEDRTG